MFNYVVVTFCSFVYYLHQQIFFMTGHLQCRIIPLAGLKGILLSQASLYVFLGSWLKTYLFSLKKCVCSTCMKCLLWERTKQTTWITLVLMLGERPPSCALDGLWFSWAILFKALKYSVLYYYTILHGGFPCGVLSNVVWLVTLMDCVEHFQKLPFARSIHLSTNNDLATVSVTAVTHFSFQLSWLR